MPTRSLAGGRRFPLAPAPRQSPRVSVAVTSYNYGRYLADCLDSVLAQEGVDLEAIVVDDASTDETAVIAERYAQRDSRVTLIRHEENQGHIATFNDGLRAASGDYVLKLDADDMLAPGGLARAAAVLDERPEVGLAYGRPHHFEGSPPRLAAETATGCVVWPGRDWLAERCRTGRNCISNPEVLVRRSLLEQHGYCDARLPHTFDFEMWMRLAAVSDVARLEGAVQGLYRVHGASMQRTVNSGAISDHGGRRDAFDVVFAGPASGLAGAEELHARARERIARQALDYASHAYDRGRADREPIEELVELALETWPDSTSLPEWRGLARRRRVGERYAHRLPPFVAKAALRRVRNERRWARWRRHGI
jgi:glycosyltransferase involved in cell wall biosynthesis